MTFADHLLSFGVASQNIRDLSKLGPDNLDYLDLVQGISLDWTRTHRVRADAVVEHDGRPLLYVVNAGAMVGMTDTALATLRVKLASRGEPAWLAVSKPGELSIYPLGFDLELPPPTTVRSSDGRASALMQDLAAGQLARDERSNRSAFHELLLRLITSVCKAMLSADALKHDPDSVLSLVGRALFVRFLADRAILRGDQVVGADHPETLLSTAASTARVFRWLDATFNGDLLPLGQGRYDEFFRKLGKDVDIVLRELTNIMYRAPEGQLLIKETWGSVDFAHVPVGLLSEVYEQFAHEHGPLHWASSNKRGLPLAKLESIHYTPLRVAKFMVDEAFPGIRTAPAHKAKILDPAAGGGVFLTLAYRRLVSEHWRAFGRRPNRRQLRAILSNQIRGFDINASALKLAALSLYLTAIELDPAPHQPEGLEFEPMMGRVLIHVRDESEPSSRVNVLGSLGPAVGQDQNAQYDVVIGNPPWTSWRQEVGSRKQDINAAAESIIRAIATERFGADNRTDFVARIVEEYQNADRVPDLPFVWKAMQWAKRGAVIAFALHARLLFKQSPLALEARNALFSALKVTGVLNGAALRQENVWPNTDAPWCLLFAVNEIPTADDAFYFVSPDLESSVNSDGVMRVDYASAQPVQLAVLLEQPTILKTLFRGTAIDADIMKRLNALDLPDLGSYWNKLGLVSGKGYQRTAGGRQVPEWMTGMPELRASSSNKFAVDIGELPTFSSSFVHRPRSAQSYKSPLVLFPAAVRSNRDQGGALLAREDVLFSESFIGYSCNGYKHDALGLAKYLYVISYSSLFTYRALMASSQFGVERDALLKEDIDQFPVIPFEELGSSDRRMAEYLADRIEVGVCPWSEIDAWVGRLYGLDSTHLRAIKDTLDVAAPSRLAQLTAQEAPGHREQDFVDAMNAVLQPLFEQLGAQVEVRRTQNESASWRFVDVICGNTERPEWTANWMQSIADDQGASRIFVRAKPGHLGIGLLAQYRYWTPTRARLCALDVFRHHADHLLEANP